MNTITALTSLAQTIVTNADSEEQHAPAMTDADYTLQEVEHHRGTPEKKTYKLRAGAGTYANDKGGIGATAEFEASKKFNLIGDGLISAFMMKPEIKAKANMDIKDMRADRIEAQTSPLTILNIRDSDPWRGNLNLEIGTFGMRYETDALLDVERLSGRIRPAHFDVHHFSLADEIAFELLFEAEAFDVMIGQNRMGGDDKIFAITWVSGAFGVGIGLDKATFLRNVVRAEYNGNLDKLNGELRLSDRLSVADIADSGVFLFAEGSYNTLLEEKSYLSLAGGLGYAY